MGISNEFVSKFEKMGARVKVTVGPAAPAGARRVIRRPAWLPATATAPVRVDVRRDDRGEFFDIRHRKDVKVSVLEVCPTDRHLLLLARATRDGAPRGSAKQDPGSRFLCDHDERSWFVAAVQRGRRTSNGRKTR